MNKQIYFTKKIQLSVYSDFNEIVSEALKKVFYDNYMKGACWFFIRDYQHLFTIDLLKNNGYNDTVKFSSIYFDKDSFNFDEPIQMTAKNKNNPIFPTIHFTVKSVTYLIENSENDFYDLTYNNELFKVTTSQINQHKLDCHIL